jgi:hypothetical protein
MVPVQLFPSTRGIPTLLALSGLVGLLGCEPDATSPSRPLDILAASGRGRVNLNIRPLSVRLLADGTVRLRVATRCPVGLEVLEALVTVSQPDVFGETFFPATCTGERQLHTVIVPHLDGGFDRGTAAVISGLLLVQDPDTFEDRQDQDSETVILH